MDGSVVFFRWPVAVLRHEAGARPGCRAARERGACRDAPRRSALRGAKGSQRASCARMLKYRSKELPRCVTAQTEPFKKNAQHLNYCLNISFVKMAILKRQVSRAERRDRSRRAEAADQSDGDSRRCPQHRRRSRASMSCAWSASLAGEPGFEPGLTESESFIPIQSSSTTPLVQGHPRCGLSRRVSYRPILSQSRPMKKDDLR